VEGLVPDECPSNLFSCSYCSPPSPPLPSPPLPYPLHTQINLKNYWSGSWTSTWEIDGENNITGTTKIRAHYFEEGNVQLHTTKEFPSSKLTGDLKASVTEHINKCEQSLHLALGAMYQNMSEETLKAMRRVMPITRSKMEWNMQAHKMVKQLHTK
jgi:capping protein (actin filament) muscle Z-line, alpha